jgi:hypothetical protein
MRTDIRKSARAGMCLHLFMKIPHSFHYERLPVSGQCVFFDGDVDLRGRLGVRTPPRVQKRMKTMVDLSPTFTLGAGGSVSSRTGAIDLWRINEAKLLTNYSIGTN